MLRLSEEEDAMLENVGAACYWLETSQRVPRLAASGRLDVDVAIVGGGFTGLWTAYHLLQSEPSLRIAVLEQSLIGFGASGRNGGFAMTLLDLSLAQLRRNHGDSAARAAHEAVADSVEEMGATIAEHGIECEWAHGGLMVVATNRSQLHRVDSDLEAAEAMGLEGFRRLSAEEAQSEVRSPTYRGGLLESHCAVLHPAKLARGLADVVEGLGASIHEGTAVTSIDEAGSGLRLTTPTGTVNAEQVVLASNAWAASTPWFRRKVVPLYTYIVLTEPLTDAQWAEVGWESHCGIEDKRNFVHYYRRTQDGRILWGGSDGIIHYDSRIAPRQDRNDRVARRLQATFRATFPQLADVRFTHHWGGPVGMTMRFVPLFGTLVDDRLHYGIGYNGHGVAPSHTGGKVLRDKVLDKASELTELLFVDSPEPAWPPEPLRWISSELIRRELRNQDDRHERQPDTLDTNEPLGMRLLRKLS